MQDANNLDNEFTGQDKLHSGHANATSLHFIVLVNFFKEVMKAITIFELIHSKNLVKPLYMPKISLMDWALDWTHQDNIRSLSLLLFVFPQDQQPLLFVHFPYL